YDSSRSAQVEEASARGHELCPLPQGDLAWKGGETVGFSRSLELARDTDNTDKARNWYRTGEPEEIRLQEFDAVLMRKDPPFDMEYVYSTYLLELAESRGAHVVNSAPAVRDHNEKL